MSIEIKVSATLPSIVSHRINSAWQVKANSPRTNLSAGGSARAALTDVPGIEDSPNPSASSAAAAVAAVDLDFDIFEWNARL